VVEPNNVKDLEDNISGWNADQDTVWMKTQTMPLPAFRAICRNPALIIGKPSCLGIAGWLELAVLRDQTREVDQIKPRSKGQLCHCDSHFIASCRQRMSPSGAMGCLLLTLGQRNEAKKTGVGSLRSSDCAAAFEDAFLIIRKPDGKDLVVAGEAQYSWMGHFPICYASHSMQLCLTPNLATTHVQTDNPQSP
jgi:hypothetical protein